MNNMQKSISIKVALDIFFTQMSWAVGYLFVLLIIFAVRIITTLIPSIEFTIFKGGAEIDSYSTMIFYSSNIFMFVIGIVAAYGFLQYFVSNGVTRKHYFIGATLGSFGVALAMPIIAKLALLVEKVLPLDFANNTKIVEPNDELVEQVIQNILFFLHIDLDNSWLLGIVLFALTIFCYYVAGWLIGISFYRFGGIVGLFSIPLVVILLLLYSEMISIALDAPILGPLSIPAIPVPAAYLIAIVVIAVMLVLIRQFTKKVAVKL